MLSSVGPAPHGPIHALMREVFKPALSAVKQDIAVKYTCQTVPPVQRVSLMAGESSLITGQQSDGTNTCMHLPRRRRTHPFLLKYETTSPADTAISQASDYRRLCITTCPS